MFTVTCTNKGAKFWLRGTTWAFHADRANQFESTEQAQAAIKKAEPFMHKSIKKSVQIEAAAA